MAQSINKEKLPTGWDIKNVGDVCNIKRGMSWNVDAETDESNDGIPVLRIPNIQDKLNLDDLKYLKNISEQDKGKYRVSQGHSIMVGSNGNKNRVGNCCFIEQDMEFIFASFLLACSAQAGNDNKFLFYLLTSYPIQGTISNDAATSTGLHNIGLKFLRKLKTIIPPLPEQRKIAEILSTVDEAIEKTDTIIQETQQLKKGLMQKLFTEGIGHITFKETKIGRIPEKWEVVKLGVSKYSKLLTGGTPNTKISEYWEGNIPWMVSGDIHKKYIASVNGRITLKGIQNSAAKMIPKNSVLVALNGHGRTKGTVAINLIELTCNQSIAAYVINEEEFAPLFVFHYMVGQYKKLRVLVGDDDRAGLNLRLLRRINIPKPSIPEQHKIATILSEADAKIESEKSYKAELQQLKKGLMQVLLTGKVRVTLR